MITIRKDTIIKPGDTLVDEYEKVEWEVTKVEGWHFFLKKESGEEGVITKNDLVIMPQMKLKPGDGRGYY